MTRNEWFLLWVKCKFHQCHHISLIFWEHTVTKVGVRKNGQNSLIVMNQENSVCMIDE